MATAHRLYSVPGARASTSSQKLVLMVQPTRLQGMIWQAVLKSQNIAVIWEAVDTNLRDSLNQLRAAELALPELLLVDMGLPHFNAYEFCRWCRETHPDVKVILTNSRQTKVSASERQWAIYQGAADLLPGFKADTLVSSVAAATKRILEVLDDHPLNNGALISVLLSMKRELEARRSKTTEPLTDSTSSPPQVTHPGKPNGQQARSVTDLSNAVEPKTVESTLPSNRSDSEPPDPASPPMRRYRGLYY